MATHDRSNDSLSPARLRSADGRYILDFALRELREPQHRDWHTYEIRIAAPATGSMALLTSVDDEPLFLDKTIEPEIPALCRGLRRVLSGGGALLFEPIDERDFSLTAVGQQDGILVKLTFAFRPASPDLGWPVGVRVNPAELARFADDLEASFATLATNAH